MILVASFDLVRTGMNCIWAGAELSYGKVWQSPYLEFSAIIFLESLYTMNRLRNIKFGC